MKFKILAEYLLDLERTPSRIEITKILAELFKKAETSEIEEIVNLSLGQLAPSFKSIVFNIAEKIMLHSIADAYGKENENVAKLYRKEGDLGNVASRLSEEKNKIQPRGLTVNEVYTALKSAAEESGEGSIERKISGIKYLLTNLDPLSVKFIARIPVGKLRLGFSDKTILDALSWMEEGDKSKKGKLEKAYQVVPDVGLLAKKVKEVGIDKASQGIKPVVGVPVLPMLPQRIKSPAEMIAKMGKVFVEPKFDGLRVLIHYKRSHPEFISGSKILKRVQDDRSVEFIRAFTRNLNNVVDMFSELKGVGKHIKANEVILDTEAIGMDPEMKMMANFQTTMQRRRKYNIEEKAKSIPLKFQVFDIIYKDGESFMDMPYNKRREILKKTITDDKLLVVDEAIVTTDPEVINREYREKIKMGLEGVVVKKYDTKYIPGRTGWRWVKMKMEEKSDAKLSDTVDCVVMGYSAGKGKRVSFGLGQFLVGVRDNDEIKTVTKVGTGLTDDQFRELKKRLTGLEVKEKPKNYLVNKLLEPDYWVQPEIVVEIAADEITKSPTHTAGLALRFPRLVKFRDDKDPERATTVSEVKKLYKLQRG
ncbi:MAG: putative DNA ligase [Candidatus Woesebacteria bacterium GW2011_GWB1_39_12]|uniref:DNA ligase (ATP) n=2 Tax=Candidatus Woeseibacteriota TaxID=1752722 RepID=A0A0G0PJI2_9BACT|nr:MAG: putative DNA ligase [Candidatus Woesebacteria bacterium GW2011_GWA1_39_12]KKR00304.1 MAG: putative DNA ligase [Candidatus Woesebacteria bacterium GW2011_GWB1_39_12]